MCLCGDRREKYGPVVTLYFGAERVVALFGYETIKEALIGHGNEFASSGNLPLFDNVKKGQGIVFSNGDRWKKLRRFTLTTLRDFGMGKRSNEESIQEEAQCLLEKLRDTQGKPFDPTFLLSCALSNVICATVFGNQYDYDDKKFLQMMKLINDAFAILRSPWGQEEQSGTSEFTIDNLLVSTVDLFFAGTESSSSTLRYGLLILLKYPEVEDIRAHLLMTKLIHLQLIEILLCSMQGTTVHFVLTSLLHNNKGFANPQEFDPHHFLNEDGTFKRSDDFMPFSAGKWICVGEGLARAEIFLFFSTILQNFTLKAVKPREAIDLSPLFSSVGNIPRPYQLCVFPR
ncbi:hypothetical protein JRQ81_000588 [Phrynocephalus forsythii]|uniref:unspecific monooxygenase n=1 Tax=Phrynocephalus forsythii TaxID=171643 RepID=A0A9Q0Y9P6_9SAUR|nr:hypothetical protein JRQ81_000588 [Phrynocephalus forsythii]